jgi:hypothetical protein
MSRSERPRTQPPITSASRGLVRTAVRPFGSTLLTNRSAAPRTCGIWISSSPSAVCTRRGRFPFREPRASGVRSYRARRRKAVTSSSAALCSVSRAQSRPISASRTGSKILSPLPSSSAIAASRAALGAILVVTA